jgi:LysM repeat protein
MVAHAPAPRRRGRIGRFLAPVMLAAVAVAVVLVILNPPRTTGGHRPAARPDARLPHVPPYWFVRPGDTYAEISSKTGLTVAELQAFNPDINPDSLIPAERLNLWRHPPKPRRKPPGPMFWTVRSGQSFGSIAAKTRINITRLEQLNPRLKPNNLQPGDRVRLRR